MEDHLASCPACAAKRAAMGGGGDAAQAEQAEAAREVDYLKKVRRGTGSGWRRPFCARCWCCCLALPPRYSLSARLWTPAAWRWTPRKRAAYSRWGSAPSAPATPSHGWKVQDEDGIVTITARSVLVSPLFRDGTGTVEVPLEGVTEIWLGEAGEGRLVWQEGTEISPDAWALYQAQTPYVGDNSAVGRVLAAVDTWYGPHIVDYTISLQTSSEPYGLTIHFDSVTAYVSGAGRSLDKRMYAVAPSLLALIGNLGEVRWTYAAPDGTAVTRTVTLEEVDAALPDWIEAGTWPTI